MEKYIYPLFILGIPANVLVFLVFAFNEGSRFTTFSNAGSF